MRHEQADPPRVLRILFLLLLLFFACLLPTVITYFEAEPDLQWQTMVQPHWQEDDEPLTLPTDADEPDEPAEPEQPTPLLAGLAAQDATEWKHIEQPEQSPPIPETEPDPARAEKVTVDKNSKSPPRAKNRDEKSSAARKTAPKVADAAKKNSLKLKLPENPYHGHPAQWEDAPPLPDLFAQKEKPPSRLQFSGRLITDEKKSKDPEASYLDTVQGAEIGVSVSTP